MKTITKQFTFKIPNDYLSDDFSKGLTGTWTYKGPETVYLQIDKESGKEQGWCLWEPRDLERPCPLNIERIKLECATNPLLAYICNDMDHPEEATFKANRKWVVQYQAPEGYKSLFKPEKLEPRDIYDEFNIRYDFLTGEFDLPVKTFASVFKNTDKANWDEIRRSRNSLLENSDGKIGNDVPKDIKDKWQKYRELLRDLPDALSKFSPDIAIQMFPLVPSNAPSVPSTNN